MSRPPAQASRGQPSIECSQPSRSFAAAEAGARSLLLVRFPRYAVFLTSKIAKSHFVSAPILELLARCGGWGRLRLCHSQCSTAWIVGGTPDVKEPLQQRRAVQNTPDFFRETPNSISQTLKPRSLRPVEFWFACLPATTSLPAAPPQDARSALDAGM